MSILFEAYTAPPSRTSATLVGANGAPCGAFIQSAEMALLGRQRGPQFSATWELTGTLAGKAGNPRAAFFAAAALRGANGAPVAKLYQSSGSLAGANGQPRGLFGFAEPVLYSRANVATGLFSTAPPTNAAVLQGSVPYPVWSSTSTYAETWSGALGTLGAPRGFFAQSNEAALRGRQTLAPRSLFQQQVVVKNYVGLNLGLYAYIGASGVPSNVAVSSLAFGDAVLPDAVLALLDLFQLSDSYSVLAQALQALADGLSLADVAEMIWQADLLDSFIASAVPAGMAQITVLLRDGINLADAGTALSQILAAIADGFYVNVTLSTGQDAYTAWVMTPETKAVRTYSNYPFNSFAQIGEAFYGASDAGVYQMGGATDAGTAIQAALRTGWMDLGSKKLKRIDRAYIGATTSGNLLLKVQATTLDDTLLEQTYRMLPKVTDGPREHRVSVGRGFRSVYWTFELANDVDGADFELHDLQVLPMVLSGRVL